MGQDMRLEIALTALRTRLNGARLALLNWPGGHLTALEVLAVAGPDRQGRRRQHGHVVAPLVDFGLLEFVPREQPRSADRYRPTERGRKAMDILQSGIE